MLPFPLPRLLALPNWVPKSGLGRIRWFFLGFALFSVASSWPALVWGTSTAPELRAPGIIAGMVLAALWIHGYRRERFSLKSVLLECVAYVVVAVSFSSPLAVFGLLFPAANFRGMYGSKRDLVAAVLVLIVGCLAYPLLAEGLTVPEALALAGPALAGLPLTAVMMFVLTRNLARHERSAARERALARAGADLMAATTRDEAVEAVLAAVLAMLAGAGVVVSRIALSTRSGVDQMSVIAARGLEAARIEGANVQVRTPASVSRARGAAEKPRAAQVGPSSQSLNGARPTATCADMPLVGRTPRSPQQSQYTVDAATAGGMAELLGFVPHPGTVMLTPLSVNGLSTGLLSVESPAALPAECGDGLLTLSAEAALALAALQLTRDLRHDIEQRQALEAQLVHQASHDSLTGLPNRALFFERTQRAIDRARVNGQRVAVLFVDLDGFKAINDRLGHAAGDQLLVEVSARLRAASTAGTLVARLGGDEFAVLMEDLDAPDAPMRMAADILDRLRRPTGVAGRMISIEASIGSATSTAETRGTDELLRDADSAMYTAKSAGKGRSAAYLGDRHALPGRRAHRR